MDKEMIGEKAKDEDLNLIFNPYGIRWLILGDKIEDLAEKLQIEARDENDFESYCKYNALLMVLNIMEETEDLSDQDLIEHMEELKNESE